jgi:electron transfer flavoprotein alpha subunit
LAPAALELATGARSLATTVEAVTWGGEGEHLAPTLGAHGVSTVFDVGELGNSLPGPSVASAITTSWAVEGPPEAIFLATTYDSRDIAARLSARIDRPVLTNAVALVRQEGSMVTTHAAFGGSKLVRARLTGEGPGIYLIRPKSFPAEPSGGPPAKVVPLPVPDLGAVAGAEIVSRHADARQGPSLEEAQVVVAGGRGLGDRGGFALVEELAALLHGAPAASRAVVDAGWVPYAYQVGQTGKTVKPDVYLAFGISGATQHLVGMKSAKHIIAVNKDPSAPILRIADLGVVGDVHQVLPKLIEVVKSRF